MFIQPIDYFLLVWFILAGASTLYVAWDQYTNNPEPVVMKWGFILVTLYLGPIGLLLYVLADKEPRPGTHEEFIKPLWKQGIGSTIHCVAGDATGIILAAVIVALLGIPMWLDLIIEYVAGFAIGLLIFQALFMKSMMGGTYWQNVRRSFLPEFISMNFMMAGMAPVMVFLMMGRDMRAMEPAELLFWGVMSVGVMAGCVLTFPVNAWMVAKGLKHGLMTQRDAEGASPEDASPEEMTHADHAGGGMAMAPGGGHEMAQGSSMDHESGDKQDQNAPQAKAAPTAPETGKADEHAGHRSQTAPKAGKRKAAASAMAAERSSGHEHSGDGAHSHGPEGIPVVARIGRHPIHPMLVTIPIGFFVAALLGDLAFLLTGNPDFAGAAAWLIAAGIAGGLVAGAAGLADFLGVPAIRELYHARQHLVGNIALLVIAAISLGLRLSVGSAEAVLPWGLAASLVVVALLAFTGWHGGEMVFGHGVGMNPHQHGSAPMAGRQSGVGARKHGGHAPAQGGGNRGRGASGDRGGHEMPKPSGAFGVTPAQIAAVGGVSLIALLIGMISPGNWVNMTLGARDVGGAIMPPGMIMPRETPAETMRDMAAVDPGLVTASFDLSTKGDQELQPRLENGVKVFDLEASVIRWQILPNQFVNGYAYNKQIPGARIRVTQGDRMRVNFTNSLPENTSVHWHGLILPNEMDGAADITQPPIEPGGTYLYEFTVQQPGTYFYHSHDHSDRQQALGLYGVLIVDPAVPDPALIADYDVTVQLQEWLIREGLTYPAMPMEGGLPNFFTINGRSFPATDTIKMKVGETLKVRFVGTSNGFIHPMHIHGGPFEVVARDGETLAPSARFKADTINVAPGQRFDVIWKALLPGKWLLHCHIPHHMTNNNVEEEGGGGLMMVIDVSA